MKHASSKVVYVTDRAEEFGWLVNGPGCAPLEYLEHAEMLAHRLAECRTVGDVRRLPDEPFRVLDIAEYQPLTSPMQETARWSFEGVDVESIVAAFIDEGWEVHRDDTTLGKHLVVE